MGDPLDGPPIVTLPERVDRRLRLGPFPSARDALKFVTCAAVGAVLAPFTTPYVWLAAVAGGFAVSVFRPGGQGLDERAFTYLLWKLRNRRAEANVTAASPSPITRQAVIGIRPGQYAAIVRTGGTPVAYLPPGELARRFELFRELLRSVRGGIAISVASVPMRAGLVLPLGLKDPRPDRAALEGYAELVRLLCRRHSVRRVHLVLATEKAGTDGVSDLEVRVSMLTDRLAQLGLRPVRLRDRGLADAARRWGWSWKPCAL